VTIALQILKRRGVLRGKAFSTNLPRMNYSFDCCIPDMPQQRFDNHYCLQGVTEHAQSHSSDRSNSGDNKNKNNLLAQEWIDGFQALKKNPCIRYRQEWIHLKQALYP
jgi:hypothetical protein